METPTDSTTLKASNKAGEVQSVNRALSLLEIVSSHGGQMAIGEIAQLSEVPLPTIHRLLQTLISRGYMRQLPNRRYALGFRLIPLGAAANSLVGLDARELLAQLVSQLGESANLAILSGDYAEYIAQVPSPHAMRMFTEVGRRVELHCTGVGKAILGELSDDRVNEIVRRVGLSRRTDKTITTALMLDTALAEIKANGYAIDDEEQEIGVRCVAVPVSDEQFSTMAFSVSGPVGRMTNELTLRAVPLLQAAAATLRSRLAARSQ